jgi:hypothetical protein
MSQSSSNEMAKLSSIANLAACKPSNQRVLSRGGHSAEDTAAVQLSQGHSAEDTAAVQLSQAAVQLSQQQFAYNSRLHSRTYPGLLPVHKLHIAYNAQYPRQQLDLPS